MISFLPTGIPDNNTFLLVCIVLKEEPETRDNDIELLRQLWLRQDPGISEHINAICNAIQLGLITFPDTLTRARRKAQELNKPLRGELWKVRHSIAENTNQLWFNFRTLEDDSDDDEPEDDIGA